MIGIVVPAHNEEGCIRACLRALSDAARHPGLTGETVEIVVVLDECSDATGVHAQAGGAMTVSIRARNVGMARAVGAQALLERAARWLAFTDADTMVSSSWLVDQLSLHCDAVCGTVGVADWTPHGENARFLAERFRQTYTDNEDHAHVHGANLGVSAAAYRRAGGFKYLTCSEDVALVNALITSGAHVAWSAKPRVVTSARKDARAVGGFADALIQVVVQQLEAASQPLLAPMRVPSIP